MLLKYSVKFYLEKRESKKIIRDGIEEYPNAPILMFFNSSQRISSAHPAWPAVRSSVASCSFKSSNKR